MPKTAVQEKETKTEQPPQAPAPIMRRPPSQVVRAQIDPQALIREAIAHGADVGTMERLVALAERVRAQQAREAWYEAMSEFQRTCPPIVKDQTANIRSSKGSYSFSWASHDQINRIVLPVLTGLGLTVSYRLEHQEKAVLSSCRISHYMGHFEESGWIGIPISEGDEGANAAQRRGIAESYSLRYSMKAILGLVAQNAPAGMAPPQVIQSPQPAPARAQAPAAGKAAQPPAAKPTADKRAPAKGAPPSEETEWRGRILKVDKITGKNYVLFVVKGEGGFDAGTYEPALGEFALEAQGAQVVITWEPSRTGRRKILTLEPWEVPSLPPEPDEPGSYDE